MDDRTLFERSVWLLLDLLDLQTDARSARGRETAFRACADSLRMSLGGVRQPLTAQQPAQLLLELAIHAIQGYGEGGWRIADALDLGRGRLRDVADRDGVAWWIADLLATTVRSPSSPDGGVWLAVIAALEGAVERVALVGSVLLSWEFAIDAPVTEAMLTELVDGMLILAPPLAGAAVLDAVLKREVIAVVASWSTSWHHQRSLLTTALGVVDAQLRGVHAALCAGAQRRDEQMRRGEGRPYSSLA